ncbi:hypothetical protein ABW20_dc0100327 [Dactylellina cionopaga]|nr:hypothetical protein ABW20_dc0100327 [Dactylellina cionopaga]
MDDPSRLATRLATSTTTEFSIDPFSTAGSIQHTVVNGTSKVILPNGRFADCVIPGGIFCSSIYACCGTDYACASTGPEPCILQTSLAERATGVVFFKAAPTTHSSMNTVEVVKSAIEVGFVQFLKSVVAWTSQTTHVVTITSGTRKIVTAETFYRGLNNGTGTDGMWRATGEAGFSSDFTRTSSSMSTKRVDASDKEKNRFRITPGGVDAMSTDVVVTTASIPKMQRQIVHQEPTVDDRTTTFATTTTNPPPPPPPPPVESTKPSPTLYTREHR